MGLLAYIGTILAVGVLLAGLVLGICLRRGPVSARDVVSIVGMVGGLALMWIVPAVVVAMR